MNDRFALPGHQSEINRFITHLKISDKYDHVIIRGPRGAGKSYFIDVFKKQYPDLLEKNLVRKNCATIHPDHATAELFGYAQGAFTGATKDKTGLIEKAKEHGVIILEEFNSLSPESQTSLLVFMETFKYFPMGGVDEQEAKVRIIATMNYEGESEKINRADVLDRFRIEVEVPPLHNHRNDILYYIAKKYPGLDISNTQLLCLFAYNWPGNFRELDKALFDIKAGIPIPEKIHGRKEISKLNMLFQALFNSGLSESDYNSISEFGFNGFLPTFNQGMMVSAPTKLWIKESEWATSYTINMLKDNDFFGRSPWKGISTFFMLLYGSNEIYSDKSIFDLEAFSSDSLKMIQIALRDAAFFITHPTAATEEMKYSNFFPYACTKTDFKLVANFLSRCENISISKTQKQITGSAPPDVAELADFLLANTGNFRSIISFVAKKIGHGSQKKLSETLEVPTQTINRWFKKWNLP